MSFFIPVKARGAHNRHMLLSFFKYVIQESQLGGLTMQPPTVKGLSPIVCFVNIV